MGRDWGCSLSMLFLNIRSARGPGLEMLEAEMRRWGVQWDVVGLAETWLDEESEKLVSIQGYTIIPASRKNKLGGGVALILREGLTYRVRTDLGNFIEGVFESIFIEIVRGGGRKNEVIGVVYRPPGAELRSHNEQISYITSKVKGKDLYIMGDFNVDLLKAEIHRPTSEFLETFYMGGSYPLVSLPTRITESSATLIDNTIWEKSISTLSQIGETSLFDGNN